MNLEPNARTRKFLAGIVLTGMLLLLCLGVSGSPAAHAQEVATPEPICPEFTCRWFSVDHVRRARPLGCNPAINWATVNWVLCHPVDVVKSLHLPPILR